MKICVVSAGVVVMHECLPVGGLPLTVVTWHNPRNAARSSGFISLTMLNYSFIAY